MTDAASKEDVLSEEADRVRTMLSDDLRIREDWGLLPYFGFRSESEQAASNDPERS